MDEPMSNEDSPKRDIDEVSIASDFSIIPESFAVSPEDMALHETNNMASGTSFIKSEQLLPASGAETSFGKVLFHNIQATYTSDSDIAISYVLTSSVTAKSSDRVALYRVGFSSPQDYLSYQWAPTPTKDHTENKLPLTVVFKASSLPKDAGEFFQFCYVTHEGHIVGVSTPFQLQQVGSLGVDNCEMDDGEDGMVVVRTNESRLHEKINALSLQNEKLVGDLGNQQEALSFKQREMEDKLQQLSMCQHHLQALETKLKKETGEKCELMGRIGQVVEEKGHLEDRVKTLDRALSTTTTRVEELEAELQTTLQETSGQKKKLEEEVLVLRKQREELEHAFRKCQQELVASESQLKETSAQLTQTRAERDNAVKDLEFWTSSAAADKNEKNSLALKFSTVNEELINKLEEVEQSKRIVKELEGNLAETVIQWTYSKEKLQAVEGKLAIAEEQKNIQEERQKVVTQDNDQLKANISQLRETIIKLENEKEADKSCREAAERIACDLSGRLQTAKTEYQNLVLTNVRLVKKIKRLRQNANITNADVESSRQFVMTSSVSSQASTFLHVNEGGDTCDPCVEEAEVGGAGEEGDLEDEGPSASMIQSCTSAVSGTVCSNCSHSTQQLSEAVHRKMEDIVRELSLQITSLKTQLQEQHADQKQSTPNNTPQAVQAEEVEPLPEDQTQQQAEEQAPVHEEEQQNEQPESAVEENNEEQPVLYSNSFLPAQRTAPVFLPESEQHGNVMTQEAHGTATVQPSAPSPTPSICPNLHMHMLNGCAPMIANNPSNGPTFIQPHPPAVRSDATLPPPLQPETTPTAIQAAVMSQFTSQQLATNQGHESDDDDFHSTSDTDEAVPVNSPQEQSLIDCPLCNLSFQRGAIRLLEEHINSHLEHVCPVCSMAFQRNNQARFEEHVHGHFAEDERGDDPLDDPTGPWGPMYRAARLLEID